MVVVVPLTVKSPVITTSPLESFSTLKLFKFEKLLSTSVFVSGEPLTARSVRLVMTGYYLSDVRLANCNSPSNSY